MARGFGSTSGAGTTDIVQTAYTKNLSGQKRSYAVWFYDTGVGAALASRIFDKRTVGIQIELFFANDSASNRRYRYEADWNTTSGVWYVDFVGSSIASTWHHFVITYDSSSASNTPAIYFDGVAQSVASESTPSGSLQTNTDPYCIGNRASDNARAWSGYLADFAIWDGAILSPAEAMALGKGVLRPPQVRPGALVAHYLDDYSYPALNLAPGRASIGRVTGTKLAAGPPRLLHTRKVLQIPGWWRVAAAGGTTFNQAVTVASTTATAISKSANKLLAVASTTATTVTTAIRRALTVAVTSTTATTVAKAVTHTFSVASATAVTIARAITTNQLVTVAATTATSVAKTVGKLIAVASTTATTVSAIKVFLRAVTVACTTATALTNSVGKFIVVASVTTTTVTKSVAKLLFVVSSTVGAVSVARSVGKLVAVLSTTTTTVAAAKRVAQLVAATCTGTITIFYSIGKQIVTASTTATTVTKRAGKLILATSATATTLTKQARKLILATSVTTTVITEIKARLQIITVACTSAVTITKQVAHAIAVACTSTTTVQKALARTIAATCSTAVSLLKRVGKLILAACHPAVVVTASTGGHVTFALTVLVSCRTAVVISTIKAFRDVIAQVIVQLTAYEGEVTLWSRTGKSDTTVKDSDAKTEVELA